MDLKRVASGIIVGLVVIIMFLIPNNYIIGGLLALVGILAMDEYLKAVSKICKPVKWLGYISCIIIAIVNFISRENILQVLLWTFPISLLILFLQIILTDMKTNFKDIAYTFFGIAYIVLFTTFLVLVNGMENGKILMGYIVLLAWGTDTFAYCIGVKLGKHKFSKVSPKKSIEGCAAGILGSMILTLLYTFILNTYFSFEYSYIFIGIISVILSIIGQIGDFAASSIKRYVDIKDYSNLLPGHGGMMDRIDSVIFIAPFFYMIFSIF